MTKPKHPPAGYLLKQVQSVLRARLDETLAKHGFTAAQYVSLTLLAENSGMSGAALARAAFVTPQTMQGILDGLEKNGHISRQQSPDHGRLRIARLTPETGGKVAAAGQDVQALDEEMLSGLSETERLAFESALRSCLSALKKD